jgi:hypothetical protein
MDSRFFIHVLFRFRRGACALFDRLIVSIDLEAPSPRPVSALCGKRGARSIRNSANAASLLAFESLTRGRGLTISRFE